MTLRGEASAMQEWYQRRREIRARRDVLRPKVAQLFNAIRSYFNHLEKDPVTEQPVFAIDHPHPETIIVRPFVEEGQTLTIELPLDGDAVSFMSGNERVRVIDVNRGENHTTAVTVTDDIGVTHQASLEELLRKYADRALKSTPGLRRADHPVL